MSLFFLHVLSSVTVSSSGSTWNELWYNELEYYCFFFNNDFFIINLSFMNWFATGIDVKIVCLIKSYFTYA